MVKQRIVEVEEGQLERTFQGLSSPFRSLTQMLTGAVQRPVQRLVGPALLARQRYRGGT
jgi:hypothetical protein